jgi:CBS-domain-containing membrane protein
MKAKDIMRRPAIVINEDRTLEDAAMVMLEEDVGGLPVVDSSGKLVGIITDSLLKDIRSAAFRGVDVERGCGKSLFGCPEQHRKKDNDKVCRYGIGGRLS